MCTRLTFDLIDMVEQHALFVLHELPECQSTSFPDQDGHGVAFLDDWKQLLTLSKGGHRHNEFHMAVNKLMKCFDEVAKAGKVSCRERFSRMLHAAN